MSDERYILSFKAATGFHVVLEYGSPEAMEADRKKIEEAGLTCERIPEYNPRFDQADLFMDMRSPECVAQFDLDDWI
ncbi:MAG: hypothetical protein GWM98_12950 [Nitrospinaceae bacterium]|nr:hypothetical protein [Nitrospinaceae bacterium]NIR55220.1 hypothetical protein [Nitrospinaceae bacterium]NIS85647.1 hypothetical protein [Nitrospinaceae bacterium]NIT82492.1 hypothetical protein [Nitrospinaceae bacterium]NIU44697.1 hypothetical protein [Nitrospinaceae bacterium]